MRKHILLISAGLVHPGILARKRLLEIVSGTCSVVQTSSIEGACMLRRGIFDATVVYLHRSKISDEALFAMEGFVAHGGGLLGIHSASASFKESRGWFNLIGGSFLSHEKVIAFTSSTKGSEIFSPKSFTVRDELYIHETRPGISICYSTEKEGREVPVVWTQNYGKGRVCYIEPGHVAASLVVPEVVKVIKEGLSWVCGGRDEE
jgi:uncharacterized protein